MEHRLVRKTQLHQGLLLPGAESLLFTGELHTSGTEFLKFTSQTHRMYPKCPTAGELRGELGLVCLENAQCCSQLPPVMEFSATLEVSSPETALLAHSGWRDFSLCQFSWRLSPHGSVKPHRAVSIARPFPCVTKCHLCSVTPCHSHFPVSLLPQGLAGRAKLVINFTWDSACASSLKALFGKHPWALWPCPGSVVVPRGVIRRSWALPLWVLLHAPLCTWRTCLLDMQIIHCRTVSQTWPWCLQRASVEGKLRFTAGIVQFLLWLLRIEHHVWTTTFSQRKTSISAYFQSHWSCCSDLNCNPKFSTWFSSS